MFGQRIGSKRLATLCRRMAMSLAAGVDVRNVMAREAGSAHGFGRRPLAEISDGVRRGSSISDSLEHTGKYFPDLFREMVRVGEESGHLPEVFDKLAEHYEHQVRLRRTILTSLAWPFVELALALGVVGILIYLMGAIPQLKSANVDILGFGLTGSEGLLTYLAFLTVVGAVLAAIYWAIARGMLWVAPLQRSIMYVPQLGRALETFAMARLAWAMHVTLNSGMDVRKALKLSLANTHNARYTQHTPHVLSAVRSGREIHEALRETGAFPYHFVEAVQVGEESGQLVESMANLSAQYQDQARAAMNILAMLFGLLVMALIAGLIIFLIFRIFANAYLGPINDAMKI